MDPKEIGEKLKEQGKIKGKTDPEEIKKYTKLIEKCEQDELNRKGKL